MSGVSKAIVQPLLDWYDAGHRDLPWRSEPTPYRVWVSEIMLQQTRVEAVRGYFSRWMNALPDIPALAAADEAVYTKLWEGLGYYSRVRNLLLGSIPSPKSREVGFFYGHPQNRFWRVLAAVLGEEVPVSIEDKRAMCLRHHVALWDTIAKCDIAGASDTSIRNAEPNDIGRLLRESKITRIFATGGKSAQLYRRLIEPKTGVPITQLPSTSPANAAWSLERLIEAYRVIL